MQAALIDALTAAFLLGAADQGSAEALLNRVPALADQPHDRRAAVRRWISGVYPPSDTRPWGTLQPDRLAERLVGTRLLDDPQLADELLADATPEQVTQLLTVYARAAQHVGTEGRLAASLTDLCTRRHSMLALTAIEVVPQLEAPGPLIEALRAVVALPDTSLHDLIAMSDRLPKASQNLAEHAAELAQRISNEYRRLATTDPVQPGLSWPCR